MPIANLEYAPLGKNAKDMTGKVFNNWTVLEFSHRNKGGQCYWLCKCTCGNIKPVAGGDLRNKLSTRCQKCNSVKGTAHERSTGKGVITGSMWAQIKKSATQRNIEFSITLDDALDRLYEQNNKCSLSGILLTFPTHCRDYTSSASLDRVDSSKGYTVGNIQWVHKDVNLMKMDLTQWRFIELCHKIAANTAR